MSSEAKTNPSLSLPTARASFATSVSTDASDVPGSPPIAFLPGHNTESGCSSSEEERDRLPPGIQRQKRPRVSATPQNDIPIPHVAKCSTPGPSRITTQITFVDTTGAPLHGSDEITTGDDGRAAAPPKKRRELPKEVTHILKTWLMEHKAHPYPDEAEKKMLCEQTDLTMNQISNWMINARRRILIPPKKRKKFLETYARSSTELTPLMSDAPPPLTHSSPHPTFQAGTMVISSSDPTAPRLPPFNAIASPYPSMGPSSNTTPIRRARLPQLRRAQRTSQESGPPIPMSPETPRPSLVPPKPPTPVSGTPTATPTPAPPPPLPLAHPAPSSTSTLTIRNYTKPPSPQISISIPEVRGDTRRAASSQTAPATVMPVPVKGSVVSDQPTAHSRKLPKEVKDILKGWLMAHKSHPYPDEEEKRMLCEQTKLNMVQVSNWMINARRRILVPPKKQPKYVISPLPMYPDPRLLPLDSSGAGYSGSNNDAASYSLPPFRAILLPSPAQEPHPPNWLPLPRVINFAEDKHPGNSTNGASSSATRVGPSRSRNRTPPPVAGDPRPSELRHFGKLLSPTSSPPFPRVRWPEEKSKAVTEAQARSAVNHNIPFAALPVSVQPISNVRDERMSGTPPHVPPPAPTRMPESAARFTAYHPNRRVQKSESPSSSASDTPPAPRLQLSGATSVYAPFVTMSPKQEIRTRPFDAGEDGISDDEEEDDKGRDPWGDIRSDSGG